MKADFVEHSMYLRLFCFLFLNALKVRTSTVQVHIPFQQGITIMKTPQIPLAQPRLGEDREVGLVAGPVAERDAVDSEL